MCPPALPFHLFFSQAEQKKLSQFSIALFYLLNIRAKQLYHRIDRWQFSYIVYIALFIEKYIHSSYITDKIFSMY